MNEGLLLAAIVENVSTRKDGTLKIVFGCQEMGSSKSGELVSMQNKVVALYISQKDIGFLIPVTSMNQRNILRQ